MKKLIFFILLVFSLVFFNGYTQKNFQKLRDTLDNAIDLSDFELID